MSSRSILIATQVRDSHGLAVALGLRSMGHHVVRWFGTDLPTRQTACFEIGPEKEFSWSFQEDGTSPVRGGFDTVWYRRAKHPYLPPDLSPAPLHPDDRAFAQSENSRFFRALWPAIEPDAFWVNPYGAFEGSNSKILQLRLAKAVGLPIPDTLISNEPDAIRRFVDRHQERGVIYKPFSPHTWDLEDGGAAHLPTTKITEDKLPQDQVLRLTPGIFQELVPKRCEIRLTMMGAHPVAVEIDSQSRPETQIDWRAGRPTDLVIVPHMVPEDIVGKCRALMANLNIAFGCFDFIITPEEDYVFIEVNEMGQFTWVEGLCPELTLVDMFCQFLLSGKRDFTYERPNKPLTLKNIEALDNYQRLWDKDFEIHLFRDPITG